MIFERFITGLIQTNTYLAYDEETREGFIVDPGEYSPQLTAAVNKNCVNVKYIILTHAHGDHIGGIEKHMKEFPQAKLIVHKDDAEMLGNAQLNESAGTLGRIVELKADMEVSGGTELQVGNMTLKLIHTPGHTKGGMCILCEGHLFCGDTLFRYSVGRTDLYGGDWRKLVNSVKDRIYTLPDETVLLPGHMSYSTVGDEKRGNPFV